MTRSCRNPRLLMRVAVQDLHVGHTTWTVSVAMAATECTFTKVFRTSRKEAVVTKIPKGYLRLCLEPPSS